VIGKLSAAWSAVIVGWLCLPGAGVAQESRTTVLTSLNTLLANQSMTGVALEVSGTGDVLRKDANGNAMKFSLRTIERFDVDWDGVVGNLLLKCAGDQQCVTADLDGGTRRATLAFCVISFKPNSDIDGAIALFKRLKTATAK